MERRFEPVTGDALVPLPPFHLEDRVVETLVPGDHPVWVVVPAFDEADGIGCALDALDAQAFDEFVLCALDNGSRDATFEGVRA